MKGLNVILKSLKSTKKVCCSALKEYHNFDFSAELAKKMTNLFKYHKEDYFIVELNNSNSVQIEDKDLLQNHDLMDEPYQFLNHFSDKKLEFSDERRVKYS